MAKLGWALALSALTIAAGLNASSASAPFQERDCSNMPQGAVQKLPLPLRKWAQVTCTSLGQMLTSQEGWVWIMPDATGTVLIPSQELEDADTAAKTESYFTKIDVVQVKGEEFNSAYGTFHIGFDDKEVKPDAYRVDLTSMAGKSIRLFFFDYDSYAWGMTCPDNKCDADTRFMILDKNNKPKPRQPSI